ncbi:MAG: AI-2E family transporter [Saprospiraceae bacterium]|nr:AI-2E family transporter [Saprospiraceae bacterium]
MSARSGMSKLQIHPNTIRQVFFLALLIVLGLIILGELYFMLAAFLGAITLYVILLYPMKYLVIIKRWRPWIASLTLMFVSLVIMVIPLIYLTAVAVDRITPLIQNPAIVNEVFGQVHQYLLTKFNLDVLNAANVQKISGELIPIGQKMLGGTFSAIGNIFLMYLVLYFLLVQTRDVEKWMRMHIPFKTANVKKILMEIRSLVYSNALGIPIVAFIQGLVGLIGYWIFGVEEFILMGILTGIASVIPIVGALVIYLPLAVYQFAIVSSWQGIGVVLWGLIVIGSVDNVARFMVQKKLANVHPLITLLGVIIGINLFGFLGVIFGPLMLSVFIVLVKIYIDEFGKSDANHPSSIV